MLHSHHVFQIIPINDSFGVYDLNSLQHLYANHEDGFEGKLLVASDEELLQVWAQELHDQGIVLATSAKVVDPGQPCLLAKSLVKPEKKKKASMVK